MRCNPNLPPGVYLISMETIKARNRAAGGKFFHRDTMRFFKSKLPRQGYEGPGGAFFVTSEPVWGHTARTYGVTMQDRNGRVHQVTEVDDRRDDISSARALAIRLAQFGWREKPATKPKTAPRSNPRRGRKRNPGTVIAKWRHPRGKAWLDLEDHGDGTFSIRYDNGFSFLGRTTRAKAIIEAERMAGVVAPDAYKQPLRLTNPGPNAPMRYLADVLHPKQVKGISGKMVAILGYILGQKWSEPAIAKMVVTSDGHVLARHSGDIGFNDFIGSNADLRRNWENYLDVFDLGPNERKEAEALYERKIKRGSA